MIEKLLFLDTETTGLDPFIHEPWQIGFIIEIDGKIKEERLLIGQPIHWDTISPKALEKSNTTVEYLQTLQHPKLFFRELIKIWGKYVNRYDRDDKFTIIGQNIGFDVNMLVSWFIEFGDKYFFSWINSGTMLDTLDMTRWLRHMGIMDNMNNCKLESICERLGIVLTGAHESALTDIRATRYVYKIYKECLKQVKCLPLESVSRDL